MTANKYLGTLCARGHDHDGSGLSLRYAGGGCVACTIETTAKNRNPKKVVEWQRRHRQALASQSDSLHKEGTPCRKGHTLRYVRSGDCVHCTRQKSASAPDKAERNRRYYNRVKATPERYRARRDKTNALARKKRATDLNVMISGRIRARVYIAIKVHAQGKPTGISKYGLDLLAIATHLGPPPGPPHEYQVDHVIPVCMFDMTDPEQVKRAFAPENHQWLHIDAHKAKTALDMRERRRSR